jgi:hypothetical protein
MLNETMLNETTLDKTMFLHFRQNDIIQNGIVPLLLNQIEIISLNM